MFKQILHAVLAVLYIALPGALCAEAMMIDDFENQPQTRWQFFTDGVMGGVSSGQATFLDQDGQRFARMTGTVSTANNGGFIQMRQDLPNAAPGQSTGVRLVVRGNDQRYFVHLRTRGSVLPWQYYQAGFEVTSTWTEVRLPFDAFTRSGRMLRQTPAANSLTSVGLVAFGRDHEALLDVREIGFY